MADVLARQEELLSRGINGESRNFYELSIRHEDMHVEAQSYIRQTSSNAPPQGLGSAPPPSAGALPGDGAVPGGSWRLGSTETDDYIFDNEKWAHPVELAPFHIARAAVTNSEFATFVDEGGYNRREFWCDAGWTWRQTRNAERPVYWLTKCDGIWTTRHYREARPLQPDAPVVFVNWFEASAWCRWAGRRLPNEAEWEAAAVGEAAGDRLSNTRRRWPWGDDPPSPAKASLDFAYGGPVDVAALGEGDSSFGCRQMIGNVWEWTASDFLPFDGFSADPYANCSQPWFGSRKVLRGGCWATSARIARPAYRNFFTPDRNDVLAGFRSCGV